MNTTRRAIYINEDQYEGLVRTIGRLNGESPEDGEFVKNTIDLYPSHLEEYALKCIQACEHLFQLPESEIEPAFLLIFSALRRAQVQVIQEFADRMIAIFLKDTKYMAYVKIKILSTFYNTILHDSPVRRTLFMAVLRLVADNNELASITSHLKEIDTLLDACNTNIATKRSTYLTISEFLYRDPDYMREGYEFVLKYLASFEDSSDPRELSQTIQYSGLAIKMAVCTPGIYIFDTIRNMKAIRHLFNEEPLYSELIDLFVIGNLNKYVQFCSANSNFLKEKEIDIDISLHKMRLIALCKVLEGNMNVSVPLQRLSEAINIPVSEVERYIIYLVQEDLASVMIDQKSQSVVASRCAFTEFGDEQWVLIRDKLNNWAESTEKILEVLKNTKLVSDALRPNKTPIKK